MTPEATTRLCLGEPLLHGLHQWLSTFTVMVLRNQGGHGGDQSSAANCPTAGEYTWRVRGFSRIEQRKVYSDEFEAGTYTWRLLLFPKGNDNQRTADYVAVYLDFPEAPFTPAQICPKAHFELIAVNQNNKEGASIKREANHVFTSQATDWGFTQFLPLKDALNSRAGFVVNDTLVLKVKINVERDDHLYRLSRQQTGFVGLKNQGSTCYMNSLLQYLYHIRYFRKAVYHIPTSETDEPEQSISLALQSVFYKLQYQNSSVNTKDLTKSFGRGMDDAFLQHDIQEAQGILCDKLKEKMKGTAVEDAIPELFLGHYSNYVECLNVEYTSSRKQPYTEIQLDVHGFKDVYQSLEEFCRKEKLVGQNKYNAEGFGLQDARRFSRFDSFPPVLQLHLKRFDHEPARNATVKIYSYYKFYDVLDLDYNHRALLSETSDNAVENKYRLHSVLTHSGGPQGGQYCAFIKFDDKWYRFDDELVEEVTADRAISEQFGDGVSTSSAYVLVYVRNSDWDRIMCECGKEDLTEPIRKRLEAEQSEKERRQKEKQEAHMYVIIKLATEKHFAEQLGVSYYADLVDFDQVATYRLYKKTPFEHFKRRVSEDFGISTHLQRFWLWMNRQNGTVRIDKPLDTTGVRIETVLDLRHYKEKTTAMAEKNALMSIQLFLETPQLGTVPLQLRPNELLVFIKFYDHKSRKLSYVGHLFIEKSTKFRTVFECAKRLANLSPDSDVIGFEEVRHEPSIVCTELHPKKTPEQIQFIRGDIIIIQERITDAQLLQDNSCCPTAKSFLDFTQNRKAVNFRPLEKPKDEGFTLQLLKTMSYGQVTAELAKRLMVEDPLKIRLTQHNIYTHQPQMSPVKYNSINSLDAMIVHARQYTNVLYYEILDMQLPRLEQMKCMRISFHDKKAELQSEHQIRLPAEKNVCDLIDQLKIKLGEDYATSDIRIMQILSSKVFKVLDNETLLGQLYESYWTFRAEVVCEDEKNLKEGEYLVHCCHCKPDDRSVVLFGDPVWIRVKKSDTLKELKNRVQEKLEVPEDEFATWRFACHPRQMQPLEYLNDDDDIISKFPEGPTSTWNNGKYLGDNGAFIVLQHQDTNEATRQPERSR